MLHSFGICVYEVLSRKEPYADQEDFEQTMRDVVRKKLRPELPADAPKEVILLLGRRVSKANYRGC